MAPRFALTLCIALLALPAAAHAATSSKRVTQCAHAEILPDAGNIATVRAAVLCLHNRERSSRGLPPLREHARLRTAAEGHSVHMVAAAYFSHDAPGGADMAARILATGYARGAGWSLGENIAYGTGGLATAAEIHRAWMHSPGHKANILRRQFREIGIGIAIGAPVATNGLGGATYTADFGVRR
jgi:uncharacterized protein YkwD